MSKYILEVKEEMLPKSAHSVWNCSLLKFTKFKEERKSVQKLENCAYIVASAYTHAQFFGPSNCTKNILGTLTHIKNATLRAKKNELLDEKEIPILLQKLRQNSSFYPAS